MPGHGPRKMANTSQSNFDLMLVWLNPNRELAAQKYESIRRRVIEILASRGCYEADDWADVVIDRVVSKVDQVIVGFEGDPAFYFFGVTKKVFFEYLEYLKKKPSTYVPPPPPPEELELEHACLESCSSELPAEDRELIQKYYCQTGREKIDNRKEMAKKLGIGLNALRIRAHRIRIVLRRCIEHCLSQYGADEMNQTDEHLKRRALWPQGEIMQ
jgi:DNA-directed RNA polymerase specialized sigma24 family protein